jgi:hypothetical protein
MTPHHQLRWVLRLSAVYDGAALTLLLLMPPELFEFFGQSLPPDPFLFRLAALPLWMAPVVYLMAAQDLAPRLVQASLALRLWGATGIVILLAWHRPEGSMAYWSFVFGDLFWAGLIGITKKAVAVDP